MNRFESELHPIKKHLAKGLIGIAALLASAAPAWAQVSLGRASVFSVLGGTNVTCTDGVVTGNVGVAPGSAVPFTSTRCTIGGSVPPATNAAAVGARTDFLSAYAALERMASSCIRMPGSLGAQNLAPGVYCTDATAKAGTLTLTGPANGVWVFLVDGALTATNFNVVMDGGGLPCNVFWATNAATTLATSAFKGNLLAGNSVGGSVTMTGGTLAGRVLANVAVTMTGASVIGCTSLVPPGGGGGETCDDKDRDHHDKDHDGHDKDHDGKGKGHDDDRDHGSVFSNPFGSK